MKIFKDTKGREWVLELNLGTVKEINERLKSEQVDIFQPNSLIHRLADPFFVSSVLFAFIKDQADKLGVDLYEFRCSLKGAEFWETQQMLMEEYVDFFPNPEVRENLRTMMAKTAEYSKRMMTTTSRAIEKMDNEFGKALAEMEASVNRQINTVTVKLGKSFANLPEPPESPTSDTLPSGNLPQSPSDANKPNGSEPATLSPPSSTVPAASAKSTKRKTSTPTQPE